MNTLMRHPRHLLVWICMATSLWMGAGWQWHGLSHVLRALDAVHVQDGAPEHEAVCEQCLQFASVDGAMPVADSALPQAPAQVSAFPCKAVACRASAFTAYASRAPPALA